MLPRKTVARCALLALLVVSGGACRLLTDRDGAVKADPFRGHIDALYTAAKEFQAVTTVTKNDASRLVPVVEQCHVHFLYARDWTTSEQDREIVDAYGRALPSMREAVYKLSNYKVFAGVAKTANSETVANKIMADAMTYSAAGVEAIDQATQQLMKADTLYVAHVRARR